MTRSDMHWMSELTTGLPWVWAPSKTSRRSLQSIPSSSNRTRNFSRMDSVWKVMVQSKSLSFFETMTAPSTCRGTCWRKLWLFRVQRSRIGTGKHYQRTFFNFFFQFSTPYVHETFKDGIIKSWLVLTTKSNNPSSVDWNPLAGDSKLIYRERRSVAWHMKVASSKMLPIL